MRATRDEAKLLDSPATGIPPGLRGSRLPSLLTGNYDSSRPFPLPDAKEGFVTVPAPPMMPPPPPPTERATTPSLTMHMRRPPPGLELPADLPGVGDLATPLHIGAPPGLRLLPPRPATPGSEGLWTPSGHLNLPIFLSTTPLGNDADHGMMPPTPLGSQSKGMPPRGEMQWPSTNNGFILATPPPTPARCNMNTPPPSLQAVEEMDQMLWSDASSRGKPPVPMSPAGALGLCGPSPSYRGGGHQADHKPGNIHGMYGQCQMLSGVMQHGPSGPPPSLPASMPANVPANGLAANALAGWGRRTPKV